MTKRLGDSNCLGVLLVKGTNKSECCIDFWARRYCFYKKAGGFGLRGVDFY